MISVAAMRPVTSAVTSVSTMGVVNRMGLVRVVHRVGVMRHVDIVTVVSSANSGHVTLGGHRVIVAMD